MIERNNHRDHAIEWVSHHWQVGPLCKRDPDNPRRILNPYGKDPVGHLVPHGVLDFTDDVDTVIRWWSRTPWNIGARVPESMIVIDVDPRHGGEQSVAELEDSSGLLPETLTTISGRGDGGRHLFYRRPPGKLSAKRLGPGIDLKTSSGYVVLPPSIHPDSGRPYTQIERPVAAPPPWLIELLLPELAPPSRTVQRVGQFFGPSVADEYSANTSWADILGPHGWRCTTGDPDADGAGWLHPTATSACSATVRNGCLFVWSTNTVFDISEPGYPRGYTRFKAYALLNFDGDMSAAARALKGVA